MVSSDWYTHRSVLKKLAPGGHGPTCRVRAAPHYDWQGRLSGACFGSHSSSRPVQSPISVQSSLYRGITLACERTCVEHYQTRPRSRLRHDGFSNGLIGHTACASSGRRRRRQRQSPYAGGPTPNSPRATTHGHRWVHSLPGQSSPAIRCRLGRSVLDRPVSLVDDSMDAVLRQSGACAGWLANVCRARDADGDTGRRFAALREGLRGSPNGSAVRHTTLTP